MSLAIQRQTINVESDKVMEFKFGWMAPNTRVTGQTIEPKVKEHFGIQMVMFLKANFKMINPMGMVCI